MKTTIGHSTDRIEHIASAASALSELCTKPLSTEPDIFGDIETLVGRNQSILRAASYIAKMANMSDSAWDRMMAETADQVRESDHPRHSIL